jgi:hypothetical protein
MTRHQYMPRVALDLYLVCGHPFQIGSLAAVAVDFYRITQYFMG